MRNQENPAPHFATSNRRPHQTTLLPASLFSCFLLPAYFKLSLSKHPENDRIMSVRSRTGCLNCKSTGPCYPIELVPIVFSTDLSPNLQNGNAVAEVGSRSRPSFTLTLAHTTTEERPACRNCEVRGFDCSYLFETTQPAPLRFKISLSMRTAHPRELPSSSNHSPTGKGHRSSPNRRNRWQFLSVSYHDADVLLCEQYHHLPTPSSKQSIDRDNQPDDCPTRLNTEPSPFTALLIDCSELETQLFQYCKQTAPKRS